MEHRSVVNILAVGVGYKKGLINFAAMEGNGYAASTDQYCLQRMSEDLTPAVDRTLQRTYELMKR